MNENPAWEVCSKIWILISLQEIENPPWWGNIIWKLSFPLKN